MARKRDGLVPVGEAIPHLDGPVKEIRAASPQAMHHFTRFDQVNQLVETSEADPDMGFMCTISGLAVSHCPAPITANTASECPSERPVHLEHALLSTTTGLPFGNDASPVAGQGVHRQQQRFPQSRDLVWEHSRATSSCVYLGMSG